MNLTFTDSDVAALLQIAGEVEELGHDVHVRRAHILNRLLGLVGGCGAACTEIDSKQANANGWAMPNTITLTGAIAAHRQLAERYLTGRIGALDPCTPYLLGKKKSTITFRRADVMDNSWYQSEHFNRLRRPLGLGESLYATFSTPDGLRLKVSLARALNDPPFTERDVRLLHIFNENLSRLYVGAHAAATVETPPGHADEVASLPPRLRPIFFLKDAGNTEKQVAQKLGLSPHTVHAYTKALYRTFGVSSRGELLARFVVIGSDETSAIDGKPVRGEGAEKGSSGGSNLPKEM